MWARGLNEDLIRFPKQRHVAPCGKILGGARGLSPAVPVAGVAGHAAVNIVANIRVVEISRNVIPMATGALESRIGRCGARMAICANSA